MADTENQKPLHIAMFPWLAFGHIIPFLDLSKLLAQKGHRISFLSTPRNIDRLPKLPRNLTSSITFIKISLPKVPDLPDNAESTMDIQGDQMSHLKKAFDGLESGLTRFLENSDPDWIVFDFAAHWLPPVASRLGISRAFFSIINAWFLGFFGPPDLMINGSDYRTALKDFTVAPKWVGFETAVAYRRYEAKWLLGCSQENESGISDSYRFGKVLIGCDAVFVRHCYEFEPAWLTLLQEIYHRPIVPLGLMPPKKVDLAVDDNDGDHQVWDSIKIWLDSKNKGSVVYVALGSEVTPTQGQLSELAHGLELANVPFFWVLRRASGSNSVELPGGFEERVKGRGVVWRKWAPQLMVLSHESVGGFLTHCGWSSIVEGLMFGLPLITLPFLVDQGLNSRVIVGRQLGVEIPRNEEDGSYTRNSVADSVKHVMVEDDEEAKRVMRKNAKEMCAIFSNVELHEKYIDDFIEFLKVGR